MKLAIIGTGYVGLVAGVCFAEAGNDVICVDNNPEKLARLRNGEMPIYEPGLEHLFRRNTREDRLIFTGDLAEAVAASEIIFLALPTPPGQGGEADLKFVLGAATDIGRCFKTDSAYKIVVTKSTVPVGTADKVFAAIAQNAQSEFDVVSNPEFLREGVAVEDFMKPERVVIGISAQSPDSTRAERTMRELYHSFLMSGNPLLAMDARSAELTKYAANSMLALRISFMNDIANLCEKCGADVDKVRLGIGLDSRIGKRFLFAGTGYGGSCFAGATTVWTRENGSLKARRFEELWESSGPVLRDKNVDFKTPNLEILAFDLETKSPVFAPVQALTRRDYRGPILTFQTAMGRQIRVTADHPMITRENGEWQMRLAAQVQAGDELLAISHLPAALQNSPLDVPEMLRDTFLENSTQIRALDGSFEREYANFAPHIPKETLRHPLEIKWDNRMPLRVWRSLTQRGVLDATLENRALYTAKGAATLLHAQIPRDGDFWRLCGYFLAEGFIHAEAGRLNCNGEAAIRERIGFCFGAHETEYIADLRRILEKWGLKWRESRGPGAISTLVSSRIFAHLLREKLQMGTRSEDKALPRGIFEVSPEHQLELLRGAFSGDGAITTAHNGKNVFLEYATVCKVLADGLALLLQSLGVVASVRPRWMNKSKQPAFLLRVSGYHQLRALQAVFGPEKSARLVQILDQYQRQIRPHGYARDENCVALSIKKIEWQTVSESVYSLESESGTLVVDSGLIAHNCFPKDVQALIVTGREFEAPQSLLEATESINERQKKTLIRRIEAHFGADLTGKKFALWGLAFKPNTDDIREAPALVIVEELLARGAQIRAYDPEAAPAVARVLGDKIEFARRHYDACEGADALVIATEWPKFREPDFDFLKELLNQPLIFDGRNVYELETMREHGFTYYSIGRPDVKNEIS